jgi:DNA-binding MarR family transcriptional regulator
VAEKPDDSSDAIAAALARLRGRRMPRPPWDPSGSGPFGPNPGGWGRGGGHHPHGHDPEHGAFRDHGAFREHGPSHEHGGPPPWFAGARFGGPARLRLLDALAAASGPLSVGEIAEAVGVDQPRASRLVQQAVAMGLARREADPDDARRTRIALTDAGSSLVRGFRGERRDAIETALTTFSDDERADLARLLTKLADAWPQ